MLRGADVGGLGGNGTPFVVEFEAVDANDVERTGWALANNSTRESSGLVSGIGSAVFVSDITGSPMIVLIVRTDVAASPAAATAAAVLFSPAAASLAAASTSSRPACFRPLRRAFGGSGFCFAVFRLGVITPGFSVCAATSKTLNDDSRAGARLMPSSFGIIRLMGEMGESPA